MQVTYKGKLPVAKNIFSFQFQPDQKVEYQPGQFTQLVLPHKDEDDRGAKRWFTVSASPTEELLTITTKLTTPNGSSFKAHLNSLLPGAQVEFAAPEGDFILHKDPTQPLVFVAGGIGVTPYRSIIKYLSDKKEKRPIQLLYAANTPDEFAFRDLFDNNPVIAQVKYMIKDSVPGWDGAVGILSADKIAELAGGLDGKVVYVSGPEPMVEALEKSLTATTIPKDNLVLDFFPNYPAY